MSTELDRLTAAVEQLAEELAAMGARLDRLEHRVDRARDFCQAQADRLTAIEAKAELAETVAATVRIAGGAFTSLPLN